MLKISSTEEMWEWQKQMLVWGECQVDEHGTPVPREIPEYWALPTSHRGFSGPRPSITWVDEGSTLHGFPPYQPKPVPVVHDVRVEDVRWSCKPPTAPVYAVGTNGWLMEQASARISPAEREYNRKLNAASRAKARELLLMMGVETFDADD